MLAALLLQGCASTDPGSTPIALKDMLAVNAELTDSAGKLFRLRSIDDEAHGPLMSSLEAQATATLADLLTATEMVLFYAHGTDRDAALQYLSRLRDVYDVLDRRGDATDAQAIGVYQGYVAVRDLAAAGQLRDSRPFLREFVLPTLRTSDDFDASLPATLSLEADGAFSARNVGLAKGNRVIAVVGCPLSQDLVEAVTRDPELASQLRDANILWVVSADRLDAAMVRAWNHRFPDQPLAVAYENTAWAPVDFDSMPDVFFLRDGKRVASVGGWDPDATLGKLRDALAELR